MNSVRARFIVGALVAALLGWVILYAASPPSIAPIDNQVADEDAPPFDVPITVTPDPDEGDPIASVTIHDVSPAGIVQASITAAEPWVITITPLTDAFGAASITVRATDAGGDWRNRGFTVTVNPLDDAPAIAPIADQQTDEDVTKVVAVDVSDPDPADVLTLTAASSNQSVVADAGLVLSGTGGSRTLAISPVANAFGSTTITVTVDDGTPPTVSTTFELIVNPLNDGPAFTSAPVLTAAEEQLYTYAVTATDVDGDSLTLTAPVTPAWLTFTDQGNGTGTLSGTPTNADVGVHPVTLAVNDGTVTVEQSFSVTVASANDAPKVTSLIDRSMAEDETLPVTVTVGDEDTDLSAVVVSATSSNQAIVANSGLAVSPQSGAARTLTISPVLNANTAASGAVTITVTASDGSLTSAPVTFQLTINEVNDLPSIGGVPEQSVEQDGGPTPPVAFSVSDVETASGALVVTAGSSNPALVPVPNIVLGGGGDTRTVSLSPAPGQSGAATITLTVADAGTPAGTAQTSFTVRVNGRPTISDIADQSTQEDTPLAGVAFTVGDAETTADSLVVTAQSSNEALVPASNIQVLGSGVNRTLTITPAPDATGTSTITVTVFDGALTASDVFLLTVTPVNDLPAISTIADQVTLEDVALGPVSFTVGDAETPPGVLTLSATSSNEVLLPVGNIALGGDGATRSVTLTPAPNQTGEATVTLTVRDADGGEQVSSFRLTVTPVNDRPALDPIQDVSTPEDVQAVVAISVSDLDSPLDDVSLSAVSSDPAVVAPLGIAFDAGTGPVRTLRLTPVVNASGFTDITVTATDGGTLTSGPRTFRLTVTPVNDAPTISQVGNQAAPEDTTVGPLPLTVGDVDTDPALLTIGAASTNVALLPLSGIVVGGSGAARTITLTPMPNQSGSATVTLTVSDGALGTPMSFTLTVNAVNDAPTISDIGNLSTPQQVSTAPIAFTVGDVDTPVESLVVTAASSNTTLVPDVNITLGGSGASRTIALLPAAGQTGSTTITVTVRDGTVDAADTFVLTVNPANAPVISGLPVSVTTPEDTPTQAIVFSVIDSDGLVGPVTAISSNATLVPNAPANIAIGGGPGVGPRTIALTPAANQFGSTTITITAKDHTLDPARDGVGSFTLTVTPVNDPPTIAPIDPQSTNEDVVKVVAITVNDPDPSDAVVVTATSDQSVVANAGLAVTGTGSGRTLTITPVSNASGSTTITVQAQDGTAPAVTRTFTLTVNPVNDAPTITAILPQATGEDTPITIPVTVGDVETAAGSLTLTRASSNTTLLPLTNIVLGGGGADRTVTLRPAANRSGVVTVTLTVSDGVASAQRTFQLTVSAVNDAPTLATISAQSTDEDSAAQVSLSIADVDDDASLLQLAASSSDVELVPLSALVFSGTGGSRSLTITPAANRFGVTTISVTVRDDESPAAGTVVRSFELTVRSVNDPPTISAIGPQQTPEDTPVGPIAFTIGDVDDDVDALNVSRVSSNELVVRSTVQALLLGGSGANRSLTIQPELGASGSTVITVTVNDGQDSAVSAFTLDVSSVPCAYTVSATPLSIPFGGGVVRVDVRVNRSSCGWSVVSNAGWAVPASTLPAYGNGALDVAVAANPLATPRQAVLTVAGQSFTVTQAGATVCTYALSPAAQALGAPGGAASVTVTSTGSGCGQWSLSSSAAWLSFPSGPSGTGSVSLPLLASPNTDAAARTATLTLSPGGATATLTQAGSAECQYDVSPVRLAFGTTAATQTLTIQAAGGAGQCAWSLAFAQPAPWVVLSSDRGFGSGAVSVSAAENGGAAPREATLNVLGAGGTPVATVIVAQDSPTAGDADDDGLPSAWEKQFGLDSSSSSGEDGAAGDPDGDGLSNLQELRNCSEPIGCTHPRGFAQDTRYLAEGATSAFFDTRLAVLNPGDQPANVLLRFQLAGGTVHTHYVAVPARARRTVEVGGDVDGMEEAEFSTVLESDRTVVVDRTMSWDRSGYGSHAETGLLAPATNWYLAEGATHSGFDLFYLLQNPASAQTTVRVRYLRPDGSPLEKTYTLKPQSRTNIWVDNEVFDGLGTALDNTDVSAVITSLDATPIIVERAMYLSTQGRFFNAGHESAGVTAPAARWLLAEGATGQFFDLFVLLANPDDRTAEARVTYLLPDGTTYARALTVAPNSRRTVWVDFDTPEGTTGLPLADTAVSTTVEVTNGVPIIVERAMWWPGPTPATWAEAHNSSGATEAGTVWALAEGEESSLTDTFVLIANTSATAGTARVTLVFEDGTSLVKDFGLPPTSRTNVHIDAHFPEAAGRRFGSIVESLGDNPAMVVVERAMYTSAGGIYWSAGTNARATRLR